MWTREYWPTARRVIIRGRVPVDDEGHTMEVMAVRDKSRKTDQWLTPYINIVSVGLLHFTPKTARQLARLMEDAACEAVDLAWMDDPTEGCEVVIPDDEREGMG